MADEDIPRRLRRRMESREEEPAPRIEKAPARGKEELPQSGVWGGAEGQKKANPFAGILGMLKPKPRRKAEEEPKFYYTSRKEGKPKETRVEPRAQQGAFEFRSNSAAVKKAEEEEETISKEELAKILYEQMERETVLRKETAKLALKEIKNFRRQYLRYPEEHEYEDIADNIYQQIKGEYEKISGVQKPGEAAPTRRRRYMEAGPGEEKPAAPRPAALPEKKWGAQEIPEAGRAALPEEKPAAAHAAAVAPRKLPQKPIEELAEETKGMSIKGLFEEEDEKEPLEISDMARPKYDIELGDLEKELKLLSGEGETETVAEEVETVRNKCPTCGTRADDIIFCPNCGSGFCNHCTPKAEVIGEKVKYICPECKKEVNAKRHSK